MLKFAWVPDGASVRTGTLRDGLMGRQRTVDRLFPFRLLQLLSSPVASTCAPSVLTIGQSKKRNLWVHSTL